jgi:hypothetical protein
MYYIPGDQVYNTYMGAGRLLDQFLDKIIIIIIFETKNRDPLGAGRLLDQFLDNENCHFDATFGTAFLSSLQVYTLATHSQHISNTLAAHSQHISSTFATH